MARRIVAWGMALGLALLLAACGGGGGSGTSNVVASFPPSLASLSDSNVTALVVKQGPGNNINIPYVSVTVCLPGTNTCKTIDNVLVDTGSIGLRLFASQLAQAPAITLPGHTIGGSTTISECAGFLNNLAWGTVNVADVVIGGERAPSVPIQLMNAGFASVPSTCGTSPLLISSSDSNPPGNSQTLVANGILGVGLFAYDGQTYFSDSPPSTAIHPAASQQVQNPVTLFSSGNNNGVVIQLPAVSSLGASVAQGYLIFGVGTQSNNRLGSANVVQVTSNGLFATSYRGYNYAGFFDSGSNGLFFTDPSPTAMGTCPPAYSDFYCPGSAQNTSATIRLNATTNATVSFSIANAGALFSQNNYAYSNLGGTFGSVCNSGTLSCGYFDWGLPFFFGRTVYTVIENHQVNTGSSVLTGPFNAFTN